MLTLLMGLSLVNAVDYDNIQYNNTIVYTSSIEHSTIVELDDGNIAMGYSKAGNGYFFKICDSSGQNCGLENTVVSTSTSTNDIAMFNINGTGLIGTIHAYSAAARYRAYNYSGSLIYGSQTVNSGSTDLVDAVPINSSHFAVIFKDISDGDAGKAKLCNIIGASCSSSFEYSEGVSTDNVLIKNSNNKLNIFMMDANDDMLLKVLPLTADSEDSSVVIQNTDADKLSMVEASDNTLKFSFRDQTSGSQAAFQTCDLQGNNCGSKIEYYTGTTGIANSITTLGDKVFITFDANLDSPRYIKQINMNLSGGDISQEYNINPVRGTYISNIVTNENKIGVAYYDVSNTDAILAVSEQILPVTGISFNNPTQNQILNTLEFTLNVSFSRITNSTYILNGGSETVLGTNENQSTALIVGQELLNNITVFTNTSGVLTNSSITFTIDTNEPQLNVNLPSEFNFYDIDFANYANYSDNGAGISNGTIKIYNLINATKVLEDSINLSQLNYTFLTSQNKVIDFFVQDNAGNVAESLNNSIFVNPFVYFQMQLINATSLTGFTFGGRSDVDGTVTYKTFNDGLILGNNSLEFQKEGYQTMNFNFILTNNQTLNQTFVATPSQLTINIFDRETGSPLSQLVDLQLTGASGLEVNTSNGSITLPGTLLVAGQYNLLATSNGYFSDQRIFTFTNQDALTLNIYMLNETSPNAGQIIIIVENEKQELTSNVVVTMLEQDAATNSFFEVTDVTTNINGQSFFGIELGTKKYIWRALDPVTGVSGQSSIGGERVFIDADSRTIVLRFATLQKSNLLDGFFYDVQENATARQNNISNIIVTWDDTSNILNDVCVKYYKDTGLSKILLNSFCEASSSGFLETNVFVNTSFNTIAEVTVNPQGLLLDSFVYVSEDSFETIFSSMGITDYFVLFIFVAAIGLGIWANIPWFSGIATICVAWFWVSIFPSYSSSGIATVITLICIGIIYAEVKKE